MFLAHKSLPDGVFLLVCNGMMILRLQPHLHPDWKEVFFPVSKCLSCGHDATCSEIEMAVLQVDSVCWSESASQVQVVVKGQER
jgi:hypothetical protein